MNRQAVVKTLSAYVRTLTGAHNATEALQAASAATLGGMRAYADRLALQQRFHDPLVHGSVRPDSAHALIFDTLEAARLDALGSRWLPGMARNLLAYPGAEDDGLRWLAFEAFSGNEGPPEKRALSRRVREELPPALAVGLTRLADLLDDQEQFASAAADWARRAGEYVTQRSTTSGPGEQVLLPIRYIDRYERRGRYVAATARPRGDRATGDDAGAGAGPGRSAAPVDGGADLASYRVYTTAHDRVVQASALASREELEQLRARLDAHLASVRTVVARLAKRLMRVLMTRQVRQWRFDLDEGLLDPARLAPMVASRGAVRPFKEESDSPFPSTVVTLLIDHSGSMRGRPMQIAALTVEIFARVLERCGVKCEVLGFTTREWDGGEPGREWAANGYAENPGRLNALEHIVIKGADVPWRRARAGLGLFMRDDVLKENIDGEALAWAHRRLLARSERRRILVVVSDGTPMDEATLAANGYDYLDRHLQAVIDDIESRSPVRLAAIGIGHDVSRFYTNATRIARIDDLGPALTAKLTALLEES